MTLNRYEETIVRELYKAQRPLSTNKIAERADMSWNTADQYLHDLKDRNKVIKLYQGEEGGKTVWILDVEDR